MESAWIPISRRQQGLRHLHLDAERLSRRPLSDPPRVRNRVNLRFILLDRLSIPGSRETRRDGRPAWNCPHPAPNP